MVVRMRHTRAATGERRSHHALKGQRLSKCGNCGAMHLRHRACQACGQYRGKVIIDVIAKAEKKAKKDKARAAATK
jgi:large subunit ribosomal protein L32